MKLISMSLTLLAVVSLLGACTESKAPDPGQAPANAGATERTGRSETTGAKPAASDHGDATDLGTLTVGGKQFGVMRLGDVVPGREGAFEVHPQGMTAAEMANLNVYLWIESQDGTQLSAPAKGGLEGKVLHFHATPRKDSKEPYRVVMRLRADGVDERAGLPLDGHGHEHLEGQHHGIPAAFSEGSGGSGGGASGWLELKLHDDKGDLELWLAEDKHFAKPCDLPLDATIEVRFIDAGNRKVTMRPRNTRKNEDEEGTPNVRNGKTNYFIFPGQEGEEASWLKGKTFQSIVVVSFMRDGKSMLSEEFVLKPHTH